MTVQVGFQATLPPLRRAEAGGIRVSESRVTLDSLLASYHAGATPEEIAVQYPVLRLADIYGAIAYYLTHRQQIDQYLEQRQQKADVERQKRAQEFNLQDLRQRLLARRNSGGDQHL